MSNYKAKAKRPHGTKWEDVIMLDDYWGKHQYGVQFPGDQIFKATDCKIKKK